MSLNRKVSGMCLVTLLLQGSVNGFSGREERPVPLRYSIHIYDQRAGFSDNVYSLVQSPDGYLWFSNDFGIVRFDGLNQQTFDKNLVKMMTNDDCGSILVDSDSSILLGLDQGLLLRYRKLAFEKVNTEGVSISGKIIGMARAPSGELYIRTYTGKVFRLQDRKSAEPVVVDPRHPEVHVTALSRGHGRTFWLSTVKALYRYQPDGFRQVILSETGLESKISALYTDRKDRLWIGTHEGEVFLFFQGYLKKISPSLIRTSNQINCFMEDKEGSVWIGSYDAGIFLYHPETGASEHFSTANGLRSNVVLDLIETLEGDILAGTMGGGLIRFRKPLVRVYTTDDGLPSNAVTTLYPDPSGHDVFIGFENGLVGQYKKGVFSKLTDPVGDLEVPVFSILGTRETGLMVATMGPLVRVYGNIKKQIVPLNRLNNTLFHALFRDSRGRIWAGTDDGIYIMEGNQVRTITAAEGLSDPLIFCFEEDSRGRVWVGTQERGINIIDTGTIIHITEEQGLSDNMILSLHAGKGGMMWVGTGHGGLNSVDQETGKVSKLNHFIGNPRMVTHIEEDSHGRLWLGTDQGIVGIGKSILDSASGEGSGSSGYIRIGEAEGMLNESCAAGVFEGGCKMSDRRIWFATLHGITEIDPANLPVFHTPLQVIIEDIRINQKLLERRDHYTAEPGLMMLQISYSAPSLFDPDKLVFRYRLEGFDQDWILASQRRTAFYTKIPPGDYRFVAEVRNHQGIWYRTGSPVSFHVKPFWYQSWWFYLSMLILVAATLYFLIRYRLNQQNARVLEDLVRERTRELSQEILERKKTGEELILAKKAAEESSRVKSSLLANMSHEFRTPMNGILGFSEILQHELTDPGLHTMTAHILACARRLMTTLNSIMVYAQLESGITPVRKKVAVRTILEKILLIYRPVLHDKHLDLNTKIEGDLCAETDEYLLYHCLLNLVDNAVKFTEKGSVSVTAGIAADLQSMIRIVIADTGIGIPAEKQQMIFEAFRQAEEGYNRPYEGSGLGLSISQKTIDLLGGKITIHSEAGQGSTFSVILPAAGTPAQVVQVRPPSTVTETLPADQQPVILLVEDNESNIDLVRMFLRTTYGIDIARNAITAGDKIKALSYDCILMDINLGTGMDGTDVIRSIRKEGLNQTTPVIAVTGYTLRSEKDYILQCGANGYLEKPFTRESLMSAIREALQKT